MQKSVFNVCKIFLYVIQMLALAVGKDWSTRLTGEWEQINMHML